MLLVIAAGMAHDGAAEYWLWGAAMLVQFVTPHLIGIDQFRVEPAHFVERHGLLMVVAFGELGFFYAPVPILLVSSPEQPRARASADTPASRSPPDRPRRSPSAFSLYLVVSRRILGLSSGVIRGLAAVAALGTIRLARSSAALQLVALVALFAGVFLLEGTHG